MRLEPFYLVVARLGNSPFIPEQGIDGHWTRDAIVADICAGYHEFVDKVLLIVPQTGCAIDETIGVMKDVMARRLNEHGDIPFSIREILEYHLGCRAVVEAERSLAA